MRVHVDLGGHFVAPTLHNILQVDPDPPYLAASNITGRFLIPSIDGTSVSVTPASYVQPANGGDVSSQVFGQLLARFPQYRHVAYNPLLTATDVAALDPAATFDILIPDPAGGPNPVMWSFGSRFQTGDSGGGGTMPMGTAILPSNNTMSPDRVGLLITNNIDLTAATGGVGADDFMVYWKIYAISTSADVAGVGLGTTVGINNPALKTATEIAQESSQFSVFISVDNGQNWVMAHRLQQVAFCGKTTKVKLAFANGNTATTYYLAHYAILF